MNFAVSDGFVMHKSALDNETNTNLDNYLNLLDGTPVLNASDYKNVVSKAKVAYDEKSIAQLANEIMTTYEPIAVQTVAYDDLPFVVKTIDGGIDTMLKFTKIGNQPVYLYDGSLVDQVKTLVIAEKDEDETFTLLVKNARMAIQGTMRSDALYVVPNGHVIFQNADCDVEEVVHGMFMAARGFATPRIRNNDLSKEERCHQGNLVIKGQLI